VLELGGKSAAIVCKDTDIELLVESVRWGIFFNAGQVCSAMARLLVDQTIYSDVLDAVNSLAQRLQLSHSSSLPSETSSMCMGSMISMAQRDRALRMIQAATDEGARLTTGGTFQSQGAFLTPTVIDGVTPGMDLFQQEVFGPVLAVTPFDSPETAIRYANGTDYGLVSGVFTQQLDQALWFSKRLRSGQVFINEWFAGGVETPFGGYGKSGYGREKGREALLNYVQTKNIAFRITQ
jgi:aldehyde dehydrogenase (NAD+)